jgi:hypothetical protein
MSIESGYAIELRIVLGENEDKANKDAERIIDLLQTILPDSMEIVESEVYSF